MNVAFFGTSNRSTPLLDSLKESDFNLVLCVTKDDVKVGRKQELKQTKVKQWATKNGVNFITINSLNADNTVKIIKEMGDNNIELGVVADFSFMIPKDIFDFPKHKFVNIHFSLLPKYRGASPVQFAIKNMDKETGITYQIIVKEMDKGDIVSQTIYKLKGDEKSGELYDTLFEISASELPKVLKDYVDGNTKLGKQDESRATYTYSETKPKTTHIHKRDGLIKWDDPVKKIDASVRAYNPWPVAWTTFKDLSLNKIYLLNRSLKLRKNIDKNKIIKIYDSCVQDNLLQINKIQVEGKEIMPWDEFENGYLETSSIS